MKLVIFRIINKLLPSIFPKSLSKSDKDLVKHNIDSLFDFIMGTKDTPGLESFIISFCKRDDLLSQWRGYGKNGAYAIGFDKKALKLMFEEESAKYHFNEIVCDYVKYVNIKNIPNVLRFDIILLVNHFIEYSAIINKKARLKSGIGGDILDKVFSLSPLVKDYGFKEESECRAIFIGGSKLLKYKGLHSKDIDFRNFGGTLIPYIELFKDDGRRLPIKDVVIGPSKDMDKRKLAIEFLLNEKGFDPKIVRMSSIPYIEG